MTGWRWGWLFSSFVFGALSFVLAAARRLSRDRPSGISVMGFAGFSCWFAWMFVDDVRSPYSMRAALISVICVPWLLIELRSLWRNARKSGSTSELLPGDDGSRGVGPLD